MRRDTSRSMSLQMGSGGLFRRISQAVSKLARTAHLRGWCKSGGQMFRSDTLPTTDIDGRPMASAASVGLYDTPNTG